MKTAAMLVLLAAATLLSRVPLLAPRLAHWDAVNYALALHDFNVAAHQPHPPGSPYFILAGRAALWLLGDDNAALQLVSLIASVGAVLVEYALARMLFGQRAGVLAALVLMTQPVFWGYGTVANAWTLLAFLGVSSGLVCLVLVRGHGRHSLVWGSAVMMGVISGFRLDAFVFLTPVWLWAMRHAEADWPRRAAAVGVALVGVLIWLIPVIATAGGPLAWSGRLLALLPSTDASAGALARQFAANTAISFGTLAFTIGPLIVLGFIADRKRAACWLRATLRSNLAIFWTLWIVPAFTFQWLVDSTEPGHDLVFMVALVALGVGLLNQAAPGVARFATYGVVAVAVQVGVFLFARPQYDKPLAWTLNSMLLNITAPGLHAQQASLDATLRVIRAGFDPRDSVVVTLVGQDPYRFMMYYLPEYRVLRLDHQTRTAIEARGRRQGSWSEVAECLLTDGYVRNGVWVLGSPAEPGTIPERASLLSSSEPFQVWAAEINPLTPDYLGFQLGGDCASRTSGVSKTV